MSFSNSSYSLFPATPSSPNAFSMFGSSPRDNHLMYEELSQSCLSSRQTPSRKPSPSLPPSSLSPSTKSFNLFIGSTSPRDAHAAYEELGYVLRPSKQSNISPPSSPLRSPKRKSAFKKWLSVN
ncbi:hypothetical protein BDQ12DRAFT_674956 [Crucibulum laeve]|uniref:Uncharacterized protein n=1 Tax=Crucibulum laeve TaxID=68775 RepID=A0A5C3MFK1_9AGAR|nr:hypothetical protein BDQ12DRAFT_674956 [Crucibulum laeve]